MEGLGSSGRLVGSISTYPGTYTCPWSRVMAQNPGGLFERSTHNADLGSLLWCHCFIITQHHEDLQVPGVTDMSPTGLPQLFQTSRTMNSLGKFNFAKAKHEEARKRTNPHVISLDSGFQIWEDHPRHDFVSIVKFQNKKYQSFT